MSDIVISVENLWKQYRYGMISHATLRKDIQSWWARIRGKEDPNSPIGQMIVAGNNGKEAQGTGNEADDRFWALKDVSFGVKRGEVLGIIGKNGAGKSTLLKIMSRVTTPTRGQIRIRGRIASLLEVGTGFHPELTGRENIFLNGAILGMTKNEIRGRFDEIVTFAEVEKFIDTPVKRYSSGMYVRLAFAVAAHLEPEILIVDEVLAVGDAEFQKKCLGKMGEVAKGGRTVLFVSHNMSAISQLTERCLVLREGGIGFDGQSVDGIEYYSQARRVQQGGRIPVSQLSCSGQWQLNPSLEILEVGLASEQPAEIRAGGGLRIEVLVESKRAYEKLRFGYSISDDTAGYILGGFSPPFNVSRAGSHLAVLSISDINLAPGNYNLSVSIGTGSLHELHHVYAVLLEFCSFSVVAVWKDGRPISEWNRAWGRMIHDSSAVECAIHQ